MRARYTETFLKEYQQLPQQIQRLTDKTIHLLLTHFRYPSLRVHKMKGHGEVWEATITMNYRLTFHIEDEVYVLRRVGAHDILSTP